MIHFGSGAEFDKSKPIVKSKRNRSGQDNPTGRIRFFQIYLLKIYRKRKRYCLHQALWVIWKI